MGDFFTLKEENPVALKEAVLRSIRHGEIAVVASENAYVYICDAFNSIAVGRIHQLRQGSRGTSCQVFIGSAETLRGIAHGVTSDVERLVKTYWPGLLTLQIAPQQGLNWDLGDAGTLNEIAVRVPKREFILSVLQESGPLAVASVSVAGRPPTQNINFVPALLSDIGIYVDEGEIEGDALSTVLRVAPTGIEILREGSIAREDLQNLVPAISS
ncbi:MAG: hypothetical protein RL414_231 [Actinomycetota bacterium]|jgi:tRNA threonylcarbamoyl adenosine modification protein (Sua5/YciO/YrdC/YwlC family)